MFGFFEWDENDPVGRSLRRYWHRLKVYSVIVLGVALLVYVIGLPHIQTTYRFRGRGVATARQKIDAWYWSVTGFQHVRSGQYGHDGCPFVLFIPLEDCLGEKYPFSRSKL